MNHIGAYVYVICSPSKRSPCKIGISTDVEKRLAALGTANPTKLEIYCRFAFPSIDVASHIEMWAHESLGDRRLHGEWFDIRPEDAAGLIAELIDAKPRGESEDQGFWILPARPEPSALAEVA